MIEPNFIVIGAGKCGTTALADILRLHPELFVSEPKEPNFFSDDENYQLGFDHYLSLFQNAGKAIARGEASGRYTCHEEYPKTVARMVDHLPGCKLVYLVREPYARIESLWMENASQGLSWVLPFNESIQHQQSIYLDSTNYLRQIDQYLKHYASEQIRVIFYEDLFAAGSRVLVHLYEFLGVDPKLGQSQFESVVNQSKGKLIDPAVVMAMRANPALQFLRKSLPDGLSSLARGLLPMSRLVSRPKWSSESRKIVRTYLDDDMATFLVRYGKAVDFWRTGD